MKQSELLRLFEDLYRANLRQSLFEMEEILAQIEALPESKTQKERMIQETMRHFMNEAIMNCQKTLEKLNKRFLALPELPAPKKEVSDG